jgi:hypothetical protein
MLSPKKWRSILGRLGTYRYCTFPYLPEHHTLAWCQCVDRLLQALLCSNCSISKISKTVTGVKNSFRMLRWCLPRQCILLSSILTTHSQSTTSFLEPESPTTKGIPRKSNLLAPQVIYLPRTTLDTTQVPWAFNLYSTRRHIHCFCSLWLYLTIDHSLCHCLP